MTGTSYRILMIEDNTGDVRLVKEILKESAISNSYIDTADTLSNGLKRISLCVEKFDVILLDLGLPDSKGLKTLETILAHVTDIPIVVLTGLEDEETGPEAILKGAQDYLNKGQIDGNILGRSIRYAMERKRTELTLQEYHEHLARERRFSLEKDNERLKQLDRLKSLFIASMSHELRTPLNSIIGFSTILLQEWKGPLNAQQQIFMAIIQRAGKHLLMLIDDVIDVSKIEAENIEIHTEDFDLYDVISEAVDFIAREIEEKDLKLQVDNIHCAMHTDRRRLLQCILNLLSNASKFTIRGSIKISTKQKEDIVEISVQDTGIGIRDEDIPKLFQPFVRLDSPLRAAVLGTGLGLYLTKKLTGDVLKGDIFMESTPGRGSRFTIKIPIKIAELQER